MSLGGLAYVDGADGSMATIALLCIGCRDWAGEVVASTCWADAGIALAFMGG